MKKTILCHCGSGKLQENCCSARKKGSFQPFANLNKHFELFEKVSIASQFGMHGRSLFEFYGEDLIAYKLKNPDSFSRNEFLTVLAKYLTVYLSDDCPSSWQECNAPFWEEFLFAFYPFLLKISRDEKEVEIFHAELKNFIRWLDKRVGISMQKVVDQYIHESYADLKECEHLLNRLYEHSFPRIHNDDWNFSIEFFKNLKRTEEYSEMKILIFEVKKIDGTTGEFISLDSLCPYYINGLPRDLLTPGRLLSGMIGRKKDEFVWTWHQPDSVFPKRAKQYLKDVILMQ
jgi:hypothetical protein